MNFQWFDNVTWDSIKDLRGATHVQPPPRFKFALQQAQHAILRAIMHNNPSSLASEPAWRALVLGSWLLLDVPLSTRRKATALIAWMPGLISSGLKTGQPSGPWYVRNVMSPLSTAQHAEQPQNRTSGAFARMPHEHAQVKKGEPWLQPGTHRQSQSQSRLFKRSKVSARQTQNLQVLHRLLCQACFCQKWLS